MTIYETAGGMYQFTYLPQYAQYILNNHLDDYIREQLRLSQQINIPILQYIKHLSPQELFQQSKKGSTEFLQYLAANKAKEFLEQTIQRWVSNQLEVITKFQVLAEDITLINYIRQKSLQKFIPNFTTNLSTALAIVEEIDRFMVGNNTTATNTYINILKTQIEEETHFSNNLIHASPGITYIFDLLQNKTVYVSEKAKEVMGYTPAEVLALGGNVMVSLGHSEDMERMLGGLKQMVEENSDRTFSADFRLRDRTGNYHWMRSYLVVFKRNEQQQPIEVLGQLYEITKEKDLVETIEKREQQLLEAQSIARVGSFDWDINSNTTEYTPELRNIFETDLVQSYEEVIEHIHPNDKERVKQNFAHSLKTGLYECEYRYVINNKEKILWAKGIITYQEGKPSHMIGTVQDVSERKRIEESLIEKTMALEKSNASLQEFASVASHDLKEPLRKIVTFSDLILSTEEKSLSVQGQSYFRKIMESSTRMKALIDDILAFASLSADEKKEKINLNSTVQDVLSTLELQIKEKNVVVNVTQLPEAIVYPVQIIQLFQNLLSNSLKFAKEDEPLKIEISYSYQSPSQLNGYPVQKAAQYLKLKVADNGIGFKQEAAEKIFGLFNRLHNKSKFEGTGLGLAICRKIAENHGGVIYADSEPGKGSVFTIVLPVE